MSREKWKLPVALGIDVVTTSLGLSVNLGWLLSLGPERSRGQAAVQPEWLKRDWRVPGRRDGQCGCQASSEAVRDVTALGSRPSARARIVTCSNTSRRLLRAAIQTCWSTSAESL